ncbi:MAG TPA: tRNA uridine-5-carboxymethylaminomethyl(34) synthesis enzyme MnmG [Candidatus Aminicenantes bacterium]|nr:tRNA uridine-5-carboxymethylaminomethyl(34) synthesis enzyme MnmG [Candidatus Aminicenantes bacterium]
MRIVVVGGGHAGIEAAYAAARMGAEAVLLTMHLETVGQMSCNPAIGGIAKGHLVREIDALGGLMGLAADATGIHFKVLNRSKGPAVRATRSQNDKAAYRLFVKDFLERVPGLRLYQGVAAGLAVEGGVARGVRLAEGETLAADAVVVCSGTFLAGRIFIGAASYAAGRANEPPAVELAEAIRGLGFATLRLKTGTPMRLHADGIDWSKFTPQPGDEPPQGFSARTRRTLRNRALCFLGHTTPGVGQVVREHLHLSPLYSGRIRGVGPRYCPSIEDKVVKFPQRERHPIFLEPEGLGSREIYVNGLSSSLPVEVQRQILAAVPGLERAAMMRPAYAIEYDAIQPTQLRPSLESRAVANLFFAGQVNGTSGYEEAAGQGLMAGVNAVLKARGEPPFVLGRHEAYIGVLIDDIVRLGVDEPYRLFTARAEYRLQLREDNAFERLGAHGLRLGLVARRDHEREQRRLERRQRAIRELDAVRVPCAGGAETLLQALRRPEVTLAGLRELHGDARLPRGLDFADASYVEASVKYEGYVAIQNREVARLGRLASVAIPAGLDFAAVDGLSTEIRQKLARSRPASLGEAAAIPGVTPAALNALRIHLALKCRG